MSAVHSHTVAILAFNNHDITFEAMRQLRHSGCNDTVLIFDNGSQPPFSQLCTDSQVVFERREQNIFVNPAWNQIFDLVQTRYLTLLNNDCFILSADYFATVLPHMHAHNIVLSSTKTIRAKQMPSTLALNWWQRKASRAPLRYHPHPRRQGWLMTLDLEQYRTLDYKIPDYLKIWFGDDWIWAQVVAAGLNTAVYTNRFALHLDHPVTSSEKIRAITAQDCENLRQFGQWHDTISPRIHHRTRLTSRYV
jgi:hypothetical protein